MSAFSVDPAPPRMILLRGIDGRWRSSIARRTQHSCSAAYTDPSELDSALGIYLATWGIVTFIFLLGSLRSSMALVSLFFCLDLTFWLLTAGFLAASTNATKAGGAMGILTAGIAGYTALAGLLTKDTSHFLLPVGDMSRAKAQ